MSIIGCYFIAKTLLLWDPRDIVQIAYHLRQKSPLHLAIATVLLHTTHSSKVNCTLDKVNCTLCVRKHTILGPVWETDRKTMHNVATSLLGRGCNRSHNYIHGL